MTSIYQFVLARLEASKGRWSEVASGSGISKRTIEKIARREIENPGVISIEKLAAYFQAREAA
jgi:transcriptional regulator with XRE-family HTH domain